MLPFVLHPIFIMNIPPHTNTPKRSPSIVTTELTGRTHPVRAIHKNTIIVSIVGHSQEPHIASRWLHSCGFHVFGILFSENNIVHFIVRESLCIIDIFLKRVLREGVSDIGKHKMFSPFLRPIHIQVSRHSFIVSLVDLVWTFTEIILIRVRTEF